MVSFDLTPNSEIGYGQDNNDMATFLQTVGHQQFVTLEALSVREAIARKAEEQPFVHQRRS